MTNNPDIVEKNDFVQLTTTAEVALTNLFGECTPHHFTADDLNRLIEGGALTVKALPPRRGFRTWLIDTPLK